MNTRAEGRSRAVAVVVGPDFEDSELTVPVERLREAGYRCDLVGGEAGSVLEGKKGLTVVTDKAVADCAVSDYDALVIPGGYSPDQLRTLPPMVAFARDFARAGKPVAAICHGPQLLIEAAVVEGRRMTSWPSVRTDLINAGARWEDSEVVVDEFLVTSRKPADLEAFSRALLEQLGEG